jgi:hypothetical protein
MAQKNAAREKHVNKGDVNGGENPNRTFNLYFCYNPYE